MNFEGFEPLFSVVWDIFRALLGGTQRLYLPSCTVLARGELGCDIPRYRRVEASVEAQNRPYTYSKVHGPLVDG